MHTCVPLTWTHLAAAHASPTWARLAAAHVCAPYMDPPGAWHLWTLRCRCHEGYKLDAYPASLPMVDGTLGSVNMQVAEQCHSAMQLICTHASYMSQPNFMRYTKYFLFRYNQGKAAKLTAKPT